MKKKNKPPFILVTPEVWESLWRVVDASRLAVCPGRQQTRDDALEFLADQEKMLRRAIGFFHGPPDTAETVLRGSFATKHPYTLEIEEQDRVSVREMLLTLRED